MPKIEKECHETLLRNKKKPKPEDENQQINKEKADNPSPQRISNKNNNFTNSKPYKSYYNYKEKAYVAKRNSFEKDKTENYEHRNSFANNRGGFLRKNVFYKNKYQNNEGYKFNKFNTYNSSFHKYKSSFEINEKPEIFKEKDLDNENSMKVEEENSTNIPIYKKIIKSETIKKNETDEINYEDRYSIGLSGGLKSLIQSQKKDEKQNDEKNIINKEDKSKKREDPLKGKEAGEYILKKIKHD